MGKIRYASPQQIWGEDLDGRSDIYSLGVVLWELLTGHLLFEGLNELILVERHRPGPPPEPPSKFNPKVSPELDRIVMRCLEERPDKRFAKASELADALECLPKTAPNSRSSLLAALCALVFSKRDQSQTTHLKIEESKPAPLPRILIVDHMMLCRAYQLPPQPYDLVVAYYDLVEVYSAEEARRILEKDRRFNLILCEVTLSGAHELHTWLASFDNALANRIVFTTSGDFTDHTGEFVLSLPNKRLTKPIDDLKARLDEILEGGD